MNGISKRTLLLIAVRSIFFYFSSFYPGINNWEKIGKQGSSEPVTGVWVSHQMFIIWRRHALLGCCYELGKRLGLGEKGEGESRLRPILNSFHTKCPARQGSHPGPLLTY
jgi:hypothetical protein